MILIRKSNERGKTQTNWLSSLHTFSFSDYYDPKYMGFGNLRVINQDTVQAGNGFNKHPHKNMEIISYVIDGALEHKDSMGTGSIIKSGEIQRMSAGTGVEHSEFNHSQTDLLHFLQIWIIPNTLGLKPSYEQKIITKTLNELILIGSCDGNQNAITIHQDVELYVAYHSNNTIHYSFKSGRKGWIQLIKGTININGHELLAGDGAAISEEKTISIDCTNEAEWLLFDLAAGTSVI